MFVWEVMHLQCLPMVTATGQATSEQKGMELWGALSDRLPKMRKVRESTILVPGSVLTSSSVIRGRKKKLMEYLFDCFTHSVACTLLELGGYQH